MTNMIAIQKITLPNGKELVFIGPDRIHQRLSGDQDFESVDPRIFDSIRLSRDSEVEGILI